MKDIKIDPFKEYRKDIEPGKQERLYNWETAIGLQDVDGLKPSEHLYETAKKNIDGYITIEEAGNLIESYYQDRPDIGLKDRTQEADKVALAISKILSEKSFDFTIFQLLNFHKRMFTGIYKFAGELRDNNITKKEWVLDGDTVMYGYAQDLRQTIEYDLNLERNFNYDSLSKSEEIKHYAKFISGLWQIHPFGEGNTRTTAIFLIKYLRKRGYNINNDLFAKHSWYFRNALVRANYNNQDKNVKETTEYLELFLRNLLLNEHNELLNRKMHIRWNNYAKTMTVNNLNKPVIEDEKPVIEDEKPVIEDNFSRIMNSHISKIKNGFKNTEYFGRQDIMNLLGIKKSRATELIGQLLENDIIVPVNGHGKGKYKLKED